MKKITTAILFTALVIWGCGKSGNKTSENKTPEQKQEVNSSGQNQNEPQSEVVEINLPTMQCSTCKKNIEGALKKLDGVKSANVIVKEKKAIVDYDKSKTDVGKIEGTIVSAGYQANNKPADKNAYDKLEACCKVGGH